ncbi:MAG: hypothetical protein D6800_07820, partial [Candidatus Zixiibacteriota bacterium]
MNRPETIVAPSVWTEAVSALAVELKRLAERQTTDLKRVYRVTVSVPDTDPLLWLHGQSAEKKCYWRDREGGCETAGIGAAVELNLDAPCDYARLADEVERWLGDDSTIRFFGGLRFDTTTPPQTESAWEAFGVGQFLLPRVALIRDHHETRLGCHLTADEIRSLDIERLLSDLKAPMPFDDSVATLETARIDRPAREEWERNMSAVNGLFADG